MLPKNILSRIDFNSTDGCWRWTGKTQKGQGRFYGNLPSDVDPTTVAHRIVYQILTGNSAEVLMRQNSCITRCVNPAHMVPMTVSERTTLQLTKTHCKDGHEFTHENSYLRLDTGVRQCLDCKKIKNRWWLAKQKGLIDTFEEFVGNIGLNSPNGCGICGCMDDLQYDHNHTTGRFRGMLCGRHNRGIGMFNDDFSTVMNAALYLLEHNPVEVITNG